MRCRVGDPQLVCAPLLERWKLVQELLASGIMRTQGAGHERDIDRQDWRQRALVYGPPIYGPRTVFVSPRNLPSQRVLPRKQCVVGLFQRPEGSPFRKADRDVYRRFVANSHNIGHGWIPSLLTLVSRLATSETTRSKLRGRQPINPTPSWDLPSFVALSSPCLYADPLVSPYRRL